MKGMGSSREMISAGACGGRGGLGGETVGVGAEGMGRGMSDAGWARHASACSSSDTTIIVEGMGVGEGGVGCNTAGAEDARGAVPVIHSCGERRGTSGVLSDTPCVMWNEGRRDEGDAKVSPADATNRVGELLAFPPTALADLRGDLRRERAVSSVLLRARSKSKEWGREEEETRSRDLRFCLSEAVME